jgi:hypothetical protein
MAGKKTVLCRVVADVKVDGLGIQRSREWSAHDCMKLSTTRAWLRRQFNEVLADIHASGRENRVFASWRAYYPEEEGNQYLTGELWGSRGELRRELGVFDV